MATSTIADKEPPEKRDPRMVGASNTNDTTSEICNNTSPCVPTDSKIRIETNDISLPDKEARNKSLPEMDSSLMEISPTENTEAPEKDNSNLPGPSAENQQLPKNDISATPGPANGNKDLPKNDNRIMSDPRNENIDPRKNNPKIMEISSSGKKELHKNDKSNIPGPSNKSKEPARQGPAIRKGRVMPAKVQLTREQQYQRDLARYKYLKAEVMKDMARHLKTPFVRKAYNYYKNGITPEYFKRFELQIYYACLSHPYPLRWEILPDGRVNCFCYA